MTDKWQNDLTCAIACAHCKKSLKADDRRILSVYDHQPICVDCKYLFTEVLLKTGNNSLASRGSNCSTQNNVF